jgi:putative PIN family toxin of toxin-antitoxin system
VLVVLDSNIFFSALISPHGAPQRLYRAWREGRFEVATCRQQVEEIRRASRYPKLRAILKPHLVGKMLNALQRAQVFEDVPRRHTAYDPDDAYLLDLAELAKADYVVTGDKRSGLLKLRTIAGARIITAATFCEKVLG